MPKSEVVGLSCISLWRGIAYYTMFAHSIGISKKHIKSGLNVYDALPFHTWLFQQQWQQWWQQQHKSQSKSNKVTKKKTPPKDEFTKSRSEYSSNSPAKNSTKARCINKSGKKVKELVQKGRRVQSFLFGDYAYAGDDGGDSGNLNSKWGGNKEEARSMRLLRDISKRWCLKQQRTAKLFGYLKKGNITLTKKVWSLSFGYISGWLEQRVRDLINILSELLLDAQVRVCTGLMCMSLWIAKSYYTIFAHSIGMRKKI